MSKNERGFLMQRITSSSWIQGDTVTSSGQMRGKPSGVERSWPRKVGKNHGFALRKQVNKRRIFLRGRKPWWSTKHKLGGKQRRGLPCRERRKGRAKEGFSRRGSSHQKRTSVSCEHNFKTSGEGRRKVLSI